MNLKLPSALFPNNETVNDYLRIIYFGEAGRSKYIKSLVNLFEVVFDVDQLFSFLFDILEFEGASFLVSFVEAAAAEILATGAGKGLQQNAVLHEFQLLGAFVVRAHVFLHVAFAIEAAVADGALEGLLAGVDSLVSGQVSVALEGCWAEAAALARRAALDCFGVGEASGGGDRAAGHFRSGAGRRAVREILRSRNFAGLAG